MLFSLQKYVACVVFFGGGEGWVLFAYRSVTKRGELERENDGAEGAGKIFSSLSLSCSEGTLQYSTRGSKLHPEVQPLTLLYPILTEKVPLSHTINWKKVPLSLTFITGPYHEWIAKKGSLLDIFMSVLNKWIETAIRYVFSYPESLIPLTSVRQVWAGRTKIRGKRLFRLHDIKDLDS